MRRYFLFFLFPLQLLFNQSLISQETENDWRIVVEEMQQAFRDISRQILPVVVEINVVDRVVQEIPDFNPWQFFFGMPDELDGTSPFPRQPPREYIQTGLGSGVIVGQDAGTVYVITNYHVAGTADEISITLYDGRQFKAELSGADKERDLALISFESDDLLPRASLGDSDAIAVGDWVLAVGNPYGLESTVTQGIISATGRLARSDETEANNYIQTDASINSGNSGGALVNLKGEIIGINTWIASRTGGSIGLGFAIPINTIKSEINVLRDQKLSEGGWIGINMGNASPYLKELMSLEEWRGAFVFNVYGSSPATAGDIRPGDLIIALDGLVVENTLEITQHISQCLPGDAVKVTLVREGRELTKTIELIQKSDNFKMNGETMLWPGFTATVLTAGMREQMGLSRNSGNLIIGTVQENSDACLAGLQNGDVIRSINGKAPRDLIEFYQILNSRSILQIRVERRGFEFEYLLEVQ